MHFDLPHNGGLKDTTIPQSIIHNSENIPVEIFDSSEDASKAVSELILNEIKKHKAEQKGNFKLGLSTGKTLFTLYQILRQKYEEGTLSFENVEIFTIDEYYTFNTVGVQIRNQDLRSEFLEHIDIKPENVHIPDGNVKKNEVTKYCDSFDQSACNIDMLIVGVGEYGQVGFNESGSSVLSRTRTVLLPYNSRKRQSQYFNGEINDTPTMAITMGIGTMLSAKTVIMMAFGDKKSTAVKNAVEEEISNQCPASYFQYHRDVRLFVDYNAASKLTRIESPWMIGACEWSKKLIRKAVIWLCQKVKKPILELSQKDYLENSLGELLELFGPYDKINIDVFNDLQHTITGWPGGKPSADDSNRPVPASPFPKTILIFSPHPDDDVISMGGTFIRLVQQGHNVHVAYETSGNVAVHDDVVSQIVDAAVEIGLGNIKDEVKDLIRRKKGGGPEPRGLLNIKAAIRRSEAKAAVRSFGLSEDNVHFLNLPFYESGGIQKLPCSNKDIEIIKNLMDEIKPHQVYMAGDLADPHGTHRVCTEAAMAALQELKLAGIPWANDCVVWLYRGAWMEWEVSRVDMAVPLSPGEVVQKRNAIYHHLSQKDIVPFPGDDSREFWQRAEERTANTAKIYRELGMAKYQAIEVFVKL